jgi:hypothetical protein
MPAGDLPSPDVQVGDAQARGHRSLPGLDGTVHPALARHRDRSAPFHHRREGKRADFREAQVMPGPGQNQGHHRAGPDPGEARAAFHQKPRHPGSGHRHPGGQPEAAAIHPDDAERGKAGDPQQGHASHRALRPDPERELGNRLGLRTDGGQLHKKENLKLARGWD